MILSGERVTLRTFDESCITDRYIGWLNDPAVVRYSNQRFTTHTKESSRKYLASFAGTDNLFLAILMRDTQEMIGTINVYVSQRDGTADIGIMLGDRKCWGQGLGAEAWATLMDALLRERNIRKVTAGTLRPNLAMVRIAEKTGMHQEAVRAKQVVFEGDPVDVLYFAKFGALAT